MVKYRGIDETGPKVGKERFKNTRRKIGQSARNKCD